MRQRLTERLHKLPLEVHFIYGGSSWIRSSVAKKIQKEIERYNLKKSVGYKIITSLAIVEKAGHHLPVTHFNIVNKIINSILSNKP